MAGVGALTSPLTQATNTNTASTPNPTNLYQAIPGLSNLMNTASNNIAGLLSGNASPSLAQTTAAYAGATAGQPGQANALGTFTGNMGANLYNQQAQQNQQTGLADLSNLIGTTSGNLAPSASQNQSTGLGYAQLGQQGQQFQQQLALQQFMDQVNALVSLSQAGIGGTSGAGSLLSSLGTGV
jgi:hypothetical protein